MDPERVDATFPVDGEERIKNGVAAGRGVILALPHMGNWDHAGAWAAHQFDGFTTVAERLKPERLFERFVAYRESIGMEVLPLTGGHGTFLGLTRRLKAGGLVCLVTERDLTDRGVPVQFFGETPSCPPAPPPSPSRPAPRCCRSRCTISRRPAGRRASGDRGARKGTRDEKIAAMCQALADVFAKGIAEHPADWHMLQKLWLSDLDPAKAPPKPAPSLDGELSTADEPRC